LWDKATENWLTANRNLEETTEYQQVEKLRTLRNDIEEGLIKAEKSYREFMVSNYIENQEKNYLAGKVKLFKKAQYDERTALLWAIATSYQQNSPVALKLDIRNFEKVAEAMSLKFVEYVEEPRGYINNNLDGEQ